MKIITFMQLSSGLERDKQPLQYYDVTGIVKKPFVKG